MGLRKVDSVSGTAQTSAVFTDGAPLGSLPTVEEAVQRFNGRARDLLRDVDVAQIGTVRVNTKRGASLFSKDILEALRLATERANSNRAAAAERAERVTERKADAQRMHDLGPMRQILRQRLRQTRSKRRADARIRAAFLQIGGAIP